MTVHPDKSPVYVIKTTDREAGVRRLLEHYLPGDFKGRTVAVKANFNSPDPFPASTHLDTLSALADVLKENGAASVTLAERSGMGNTADVLREMGVTALAARKGFDVVVLNDLDDVRHWEKQGTAEGFHWKHGYLFPRLFDEADAIVQTCCLKTHRFGGHFTMSLKNSVGMVARHDPETGHDYMRDLHLSPFHQRHMIAEVNTSYTPAFVVMDGIKGFSHGGPEEGTVIEPGVLLASDDRVALDACGVAVLRTYGTTPEVSHGGIFQQAQLARAAQLGLGASGADQVDVVPLNDEARDICHNIERQLRGTVVVER
ncbi:MAG TPA: DUF362 domain-containing protein [Methanocella sp.]|nr:DUF362 domain-containing protein [Methanocella sp.]